MRYSGYYNCKMCGKTWWHKSNWVPFELVDWIYNLLFLYTLLHNLNSYMVNIDFPLLISYSILPLTPHYPTYY